MSLRNKNERKRAKEFLTLNLKKINFFFFFFLTYLEVLMWDQVLHEEVEGLRKFVASDISVI